MAIEKEIWSAVLKENFIPDTSFLSRSTNMSEFVEYDKIHLAEAGVDPKVLLDNAIFPVPASQRPDVPLEIALHTLDTENTIVRNLEEMQSAYNKMDSVVRGHRQALRRKCAAMAAHNWAPAKTGELTPVRFASGATNAKTGHQAIAFEDILRLRAWFLAHDVPLDSLVLVMNADHETDLQLEDMKLYKSMIESGKLFGISYFTTSLLPTYTEAGTKKAMGAAAIAGDMQSSLMYCDTEVMHAMGSTQVFAKYKDPGERGDVIGFQQRFTALPIRGKYTAALVSTKATVDTSTEEGGENQ